MWAGFIADALDMTPEQRADHERNRALHFARIVERGKVYSQPFSEGGAAAAGKAPWGTLARARWTGGYVVSGKKIFASLAGAADSYGVLCTLDRPERAGGARGATRCTWRCRPTRPASASSATGTRWACAAPSAATLLFNDVFVPHRRAPDARGPVLPGRGRFPHMFATLSPTYMGVAQAAYDFTVRTCAPRCPACRRSSAACTRPSSTRWPRCASSWSSHAALFLQNARDALHRPRQGHPHAPVRGALHDHGERQRHRRLAIRTCGGQSMLKTLPLERLYRDSRCGSLMLPWTAELCMDRLGRECLYEAGETDEASSERPSVPAFAAQRRSRPTRWR